MLLALRPAQRLAADLAGCVVRERQLGPESELHRCWSAFAAIPEKKLRGCWAWESVGAELVATLGAVQQGAA